MTSMRFVGLGILLAVFIIVPLNVGDYYVDVFTLLLINIVLAYSFRFIANAGDMSFAHISLMGMGSFAAGIAATRFGLPFWSTLLIAPIVSAISGVVICIPLMRTKGFYFFTASYVVGQAIWLMWVKLDIFGRFTGIRNIPYPNIFGIDLSNLTYFYFVTLIVALLCLLIMYRLEHSRVGLAIMSIPENDKLAQSIGINLNRYRTIAFGVGSFFAGVAGALLAYRLRSVSPNTYVTQYGLYLLVWVVFGGLKNFKGPFLGVLVLTTINQIVLKMSDLSFLTPLFYGVLLIATLLWVPDGLASIGKKITGISPGSLGDLAQIGKPRRSN